MRSYCNSASTASNFRLGVCGYPIRIDTTCKRVQQILLCLPRKTDIRKNELRSDGLGGNRLSLSTRKVIMGRPSLLSVILPVHPDVDLP